MPGKKIHHGFITLLKKSLLKTFLSPVLNMKPLCYSGPHAAKHGTSRSLLQKPLQVGPLVAYINPRRNTSLISLRGFSFTF